MPFKVEIENHDRAPSYVRIHALDAGGRKLDTLGFSLSNAHQPDMILDLERWFWKYASSHEEGTAIVNSLRLAGKTMLESKNDQLLETLARL